MSFTKKFYTSDHHFGHARIIDYCKRPFATSVEMDEAMITEWNRVVSTHDIVYHLGDFSLHYPERTREIFQRLHGRKFLIVGNHDLGRKGRLQEMHETLGWEQPPVQAMSVKDNGRMVYLHHYACRTWPGQQHGDWHFFGHSHGNMPAMGRSRDVGVDMPDAGFAPMTFEQLTAGLEA
jgi:calcineurin-like phosphoesterase family protein